MEVVDMFNTIAWSGLIILMMVAFLALVVGEVQLLSQALDTSQSDATH